MLRCVGVADVADESVYGAAGVIPPDGRAGGHGGIGSEGGCTVWRDTDGVLW